MIGYNLFDEDIYLAEFVDPIIEFEVHEDLITESDMLILNYDIQRFIIEQDNQIFMQLKYDVVKENVIDKIKESLLKIIEKVILYIKKLITFIRVKRTKINENNFRDVKKAYTIMKLDKGFFKHHFIDNISYPWHIIFQDELIDYIKSTKLSIFETGVINELNKIMDICADIFSKIINNNEHIDFTNNRDIEFYSDLREALYKYPIPNKGKEYYIKMGVPKFLFSYAIETYYFRDMFRQYEQRSKKIMQNANENKIIEKLDAYFDKNIYTDICNFYDTNEKKINKLENKFENLYNDIKTSNIQERSYDQYDILRNLYLIATKIILEVSHIYYNTSDLLYHANEINKSIFVKYEVFKSLHQ